MPMTRFCSWSMQPVTVAVVAAACLAGAAAPAHAAHRARLSADLADGLAVGSPAMNVIVDGDRATVDAIAARYNVTVKRYLTSGAVLRVNAGQLEALQQDDSIDHLSGDVPIRASDVTAEAIGADQVWAGEDSLQPLTGEGVTVAVIDSGIDPSHVALAHRVLASVDFTGGDGIDRYGHGTHVAALVAGQSAADANVPAFSGVAPGAYIVNERALGDDGSGTVSSVIEAIDWAIAHRRDYNIQIINLSLGAPVLQPYRDDPLCEAVERAVHAGIVVVAAAGNYGETQDGRPIIGGIVSPGNSPFAITVGALDTHGTPQRSDDTVAAYSSRGPTRYDLVLKPDVVAPGSHVVSAEAPGSFIATTYPQRHVAGEGEDGYIQLSGTSMATAVVSGTAALLLEERGHLTPGQVKVALQLTATFLPSAGLIGGGAGSVNALAAAEFVDGRPHSGLPTTTVSGETTTPGGIATARNGAANPSSLVWGDILVWGNVEGSILVWGNNDLTSSILVWGNEEPDADILVWGNDLATGDILVWGDQLVRGDILVWGNSGADADILVWGNSDANADILVWGNVLQDGAMND
ncbi:MAG: S8 family peptidase [Betaproteobacteria bacterium]